MADNTEPGTLAIELGRAVMCTSRRLRREAAGDPITPGQYTVLAHLRSRSHSIRELAEREYVQAPTMTRTVNVLAERGFVSRSAHPHDGRQIHVAITPAGEAIMTEIRGQRAAWLAQRLAQLSEEERWILSRAAHIIRGLARATDRPHAAPRLP